MDWESEARMIADSPRETIVTDRHCGAIPSWKKGSAVAYSSDCGFSSKSLLPSDRRLLGVNEGSPHETDFKAR